MLLFRRVYGCEKQRDVCPSDFPIIVHRALLLPRARLGAMYKTLMLRFQCITRRHSCALNTVTGTFLLPTNDETSAGGKSH